MRILVKNGRVIDPANNIDAVCDILIDGTKIAEVDRHNGDTSLEVSPPSTEVIDATGRIVMPGIVDMHVHLREPGREDKETISSATKAAGHGGVTSVLAMPNTSPCIDCAESIELLKNIIRKSAVINVFVCGAITRNRLGKELADITGLDKFGAIAISDDGASVDDDKLMKEALILAKKKDILALCHSEDRSLSNNGVVNLGFTSTRLGLRGISKESEYKRVQRDIDLAQATGARLHITHVSCAESVEIIRKAKKEGVKISADVTPHHLSLTDEAVLAYDPNFKMNPPLRGKDDLSALRQGLKDATIDAIASDHAPHTENEKEIEFDRAEFGVIGLETELAVGITELVENNLLDWPGLIRKLSLNPARILKIDKGTLGVGKDADIIIVDPNKEWIVKKESIASKSKNSAFLGRKLKGVVEYTIVGGKILKCAS
jgi:dihydroorotase